jgi:hypothetical protein
VESVPQRFHEFGSACQRREFRGCRKHQVGVQRERGFRTICSGEQHLGGAAKRIGAGSGTRKLLRACERECVAAVRAPCNYDARADYFGA